MNNAQLFRESVPIRFLETPRSLSEYILIADVITKAALSPQLFKDPECWSGRNRTRDLPHGIPGAQSTEPPVRVDSIENRANCIRE